MWDPARKLLYREYQEDTFDGSAIWVLHTPSSSERPYSQGIIDPAKKSRSATSYPIIPIIFAFRGYHEQFFDYLDKFEVTNRSVMIANHRCVELTRESRAIHQRELLYLDAERDFIVVRHLLQNRNGTFRSLSVEYSPDPTVGWVPASWEHVCNAGSGAPDQSGRRTVTHFEFNTPIPEAEFQIRWPTATRVADSRSGQRMEYVVRPDGNRGPEAPTTARMTYEELAHGSVPSNRWLLYGSAVLLAFTIMAWLAVRRRRLLLARRPVSGD
jgi:hypothetical protein